VAHWPKKQVVGNCQAPTNSQFRELTPASWGTLRLSPCLYVEGLPGPCGFTHLFCPTFTDHASMGSCIVEASL